MENIGYIKEIENKIILFLESLYHIGDNEKQKFLNQIRMINVKEKEELLLFLYSRYNIINDINNRFNISVKKLFNKEEEKIDNIFIS